MARPKSNWSSLYQQVLGSMKSRNRSVMIWNGVQLRCRGPTGSVPALVRTATSIGPSTSEILRDVARAPALSDNTGMTLSYTPRNVTDATTEARHGMQGMFSFVDIFAGIGGMRFGFEAAGGECVFTCEWDRFSQETYRANFGQEEIAGDIREIAAADVPPHDLLLAGFPCQPFSLAGISKKTALNEPHGFACETQGTLFFDLVRLIEYHRPKAFLLENVKHFLRHDGGRTFEVVRSILEDELEYHVSHRIIDAKAWVPQHRERIFIAGFRDATDFDLGEMPLPADSDRPELCDILHPEDGSEEPEAHYTEGEFATVGERYTLSEHLWDYLQAYAAKHRKKGNGFGYGLVGPQDTARTLSARYYKDGSEILVKQDGRRPRRLTPRECSRLMGFDRLTESRFVIPVSDTQAYRQFGNAVAVPCVEAIAKYMVNRFV